METFNPSCSICYDDYNANSSLATMRCGHVYHGNCLLEWFTHLPTCPICKHRGIPFKIYLNHASHSETPPLTDQHASELQQSNLYWKRKNVLAAFIVLLVLISGVLLFITNRTNWSTVVSYEMEIDKLQRVIEELREENLKLDDKCQGLYSVMINCIFYVFLSIVIMFLSTKLL